MSHAIIKMAARKWAGNKAMYLALPLAMRSGLTRIVTLLPHVCGQAFPVRAVLASSSCRLFSDEGDARAHRQYQEGAREQDGEARNRARRVSLATGSAVAALGAAYILYNNQFKLKAQGEVRGCGEWVCSGSGSVQM